MFRDRREAGNQLGTKLIHYKGAMEILVLACRSEGLFQPSRSPDFGQVSDNVVRLLEMSQAQG